MSAYPMLQKKWLNCMLLLLIIFSTASDAYTGVSIGTKISSLESASDVVSALQSHSIKHVRMLDNSHQMLKSLASTGIEAMLSIPNDQVQARGPVSRRMMYSLGLQVASHAIIEAAGATFCVANQNADPSALVAGLNWACGPGGADCSAIQPGQPCYDANNLAAVASYAYNNYFQRMKATGGTCSFNNTAMLTPNDPSHGSCIFTGSSGAGTNPGSGGGGTNSSSGGGPIFPNPPIGPSAFDNSVPTLQLVKLSYLLAPLMLLFWFVL